MNADGIISSLQQLRFENTFNPYFERCPIHDVTTAPELRCDYLFEMLEQAALTNLDAIWVGRDLGYRGGRRTGLALTDDVHFFDHLARWRLDSARPTFGKPVAERTASAIWNILFQVKVPVFLWNVFPLHPFQCGAPFSNRSHSAREREAGIDVLNKIVEYVKPRRFVAIGNDAFSVLSTTFPNEDVCKVRHPSYGGQSEFIEQIKSLYFGDVVEPKQELFDG